MIKHTIIILTLILIVAGSCESDAQQQYKHSMFYFIKNEVKNELVNVAKENRQSANPADIKTDLENKLYMLAKNHSQMDYTVFVDRNDDITTSTVLIGYEDVNGFIGWKFDSIYTNDNVYMFSKTLLNRNIDFQASADEYYQWDIIKK